MTPEVMANLKQREWDIFYLGLAEYISRKSKDPSTKTGAAIVRPDKSLCSVGFNGFAQNMPDMPELYANRDEKYSRIVHCEVNAQIFSRDSSLRGYTLYTWPFASCDRCVVQMLQAGIARFVFPEIPENLRGRWKDSVERSKKYILECKATYMEIPLTDLTSILGKQP